MPGSRLRRRRDGLGRGHLFAHRVPQRLNLVGLVAERLSEDLGAFGRRPQRIAPWLISLRRRLGFDRHGLGRGRGVVQVHLDLAQITAGSLQGLRKIRSGNRDALERILGCRGVARNGDLDVAFGHGRSWRSRRVALALPRFNNDGDGNAVSSGWCGGGVDRVRWRVTTHLPLWGDAGIR